MSNIRFPIQSAILFALAFRLLAPVVGQTNDQQLEKIAADWANRQKRVQRIRYRVSGEVLLPRKNVTDDNGKPLSLPGEQTIKAPFRWTYLLDFRTNRHRLEIEEHLFYVPGNKLFRQSRVLTFDGESAWASVNQDQDSPREANDADIGISSGDLQNYRIEPDLFPPFYGQGIIPYAGGGRLYPGHLRFETDTESLTVQGQTVLEGRPCLVLRTPASQGTNTTFDELWVDLARDSALVRHSRFADNVPRTDLVITYRETPYGWLPDHWEQTLRAGTKVLEIKRARVDSLEVDPAVSDSDFRIEEKPGMLVITGVNPASDPRSMEPPSEPTNVHRFRIDENGRRREVVFENAVEKRIAGKSWLWWSIAVVAAGCAVLICGYLIRRRRAGRV